MLRTSLRSVRVLGGKPIAAAARPQWLVSTSRQSGVLGRRCYADDKKPVSDVKPTVLPTSETITSERDPAPKFEEAAKKPSVAPEGVPLTPPEPSSSKSASAKPATTTIDDVGETKAKAESVTPPPIPPAPKRPGFFRRLRNFVFTLIVLGAVGFSGGVWYSRINDNFHDFFTAYVPFGEQAVLYLEEMEFKKKYPKSTSRSSAPRPAGDAVRIPAHSGASWRVADSNDTGARHSSAAGSETKKSAVKEPKQSQSPAEAKAAVPKPADPVEKVINEVVTKAEEKPAAAPQKEFKAPEVNEPSRFPPLKPIDLMELPDAKEPLVRDLVHMLNDLILVINADGAHGKYASTIGKAKDEIKKVGGKLNNIKSDVEKKAAKEIRFKVEEFDKAAVDLIGRVERAMINQEAQFRQEFEEEISNVRSSYDDKIKLLLEREKKLQDEKLQNQLLQQAIALKKEFQNEVMSRVEQERDSRLGKLNELSAAVSQLEKLAVGWNDVIDNNLKTQQLHVAVEAVRTSLQNAEHPRPFIQELVALKEIASDDPVVDAAIASVNPSAYQRGVSPAPQLIDRFRRVANEVRKASLLPDDAGVASHASSWVLSHVMFKKQGLAEGNDVESILTRTQTYLEEGDLDAAAREMNGLDGWAKTLSKDWLTEVRKVLEVQQALDVIATEARLQSLRVESA
ncbi:mitochondrion protein [Stachybotrys elegans]|uniref:MICOS complex subunit MIC60 n=1 Tax=Stachybotrys elegans TaxID=80388 RepID=A0A8K0SSX5_9HYPO|nr:mitochondrion protein [Stachybotrys elegans]